MDPEPLDYSLAQVKGPPLWRTSFSIHFKPKITNIVHKVPPSNSLGESSEASLNSEKKKRYLRLNQGPMIFDSVGFHWLKTEKLQTTPIAEKLLFNKQRPLEIINAVSPE